MDETTETEKVAKILAEMKKPTVRVIALDRLHLYSDASIPALLESSGAELWISDNSGETKIPFSKELVHPSKRNILLYLLEQQRRLDILWKTIPTDEVYDGEEEENSKKKRKVD